MNRGTDALLFKLLADESKKPGRPFVSGVILSGLLGVGRAAVWKHVRRLRAKGVRIEALPRRGYRLARPIDLLDSDAIGAAFARLGISTVRNIECAWETGSTNTDLLGRPAPPPGSADVLTAEFQHGGRGRRGRRWLMPPGQGLCLSWSWALETLPRDAGSLSLAVGVAAVKALRSFGISGVELKWPNDLVIRQGKVGGILIELRAEAGGTTLVVVGIGLNLWMPVEVRLRIATEGNQAAGLSELADALPARSDLVAALVHEGIKSVNEVAARGFGTLRDQYAAMDCLRGRAIVVSGQAEPLYGVAAGIDMDGALLVHTGAGARRVVSGDVSVRPVAPEGFTGQGVSTS